MARKPGVVLFLALFAAALTGLSPAAAGSGTETYILGFGEHTNAGVAPNGDTVEITCHSRGNLCGTFSVHPKSLPSPPAGEFVHKDPAGNVLGGGTWTATRLISFVSYGCGVVVFPEPDEILPPNFCGGQLKMAIALNTPQGQFDATLSILCIVGPNPPTSHDDPSEEGVTLNIPGVINFNKTAGGENIYILQ